MICTDCNEPITETESRARRTCVICEHPLHAECAMVGAGEVDLCEDCYELDEAGFVEAMGLRGVQA
jgi:hypothetical protein